MFGCDEHVAANGGEQNGFLGHEWGRNRNIYSFREKGEACLETSRRSGIFR